MTRIGVIGHRHLPDESQPLIQAALRRVLVAKAGSRLIGVTCLITAADQLFARTVLELSGRLEVILPAADYRDSQVTDGDCPMFDQLLAAASSVRVMTFPTCSRQAYLAAGKAMLTTVETLVAIWDGQPARRFGTTAAMVDAAARLGVPTSIVWPAGARRDRDARPPGAPAALSPPAPGMPPAAADVAGPLQVG